MFTGNENIKLNKCHNSTNGFETIFTRQLSIKFPILKLQHTETQTGVVFVFYTSLPICCHKNKKSLHLNGVLACWKTPTRYAFFLLVFESESSWRK